MTTPVKNVEILTTLDEEPHVKFFPWQPVVHDTASGMAKSQNRKVKENLTIQIMPPTHRPQQLMIIKREKESGAADQFLENWLK